MDGQIGSKAHVSYKYYNSYLFPFSLCTERQNDLTGVYRKLPKHRGDYGIDFYYSQIKGVRVTRNFATYKCCILGSSHRQTQMYSYVVGYRYLVIYGEANRSVLECKGGIYEALCSNPGRARYFFTTWYIGAQRGARGSSSLCIRDTMGSSSAHLLMALYQWLIFSSNSGCTCLSN